MKGQSNSDQYTHAYGKYTPNRPGKGVMQGRINTTEMTGKLAICTGLLLICVQETCSQPGKWLINSIRRNN